MFTFGSDGLIASNLVNFESYKILGFFQGCGNVDHVPMFWDRFQRMLAHSCCFDIGCDVSGDCLYDFEEGRRGGNVLIVLYLF